MSLYASADLDVCRARQHRFRLTSSDKTPMKVSLLCETCTLSSGKTTYCAYGQEQGSFGAWRRTARKDDGKHDPVKNRLQPARKSEKKPRTKGEI